MPASANRAKRVHVSTRIVRCAQALAEERGLDGFTMDDVAEHVGVSRRTLFNHVPGKLDAVLGASKADPAALREFLDGGPTGNLRDDVRAAMVGVLDSKGTPHEEVQRVRRLVAAEARLHKALHDRFGAMTNVLADAILQREGAAIDALGARATATVALALFDIALDSYLEDPSTTLAECYASVYDRAAMALGGPGAPRPTTGASSR